MIVFQKNVQLQPFNTFGLEAKATNFVAFQTVDELKESLIQRADHPLLVLGGGSNVLLTQDFDGLVLKNELKGIKIVREDANHVWVEVQAGENWHEFVMTAIANDWAGIENMSLIPGTMGAAPMQNIGAYGVEIKQVFDRLTALELSLIHI